MYKSIDKSLFTADELAQYEALIAKATVEVEDDEPEAEIPETNPAAEPAQNPTVEPTEPTQKSAPAAPAAAPEVPDFVKAAIAKSEEFMTRIEKQEMAEVAKKYEILGNKPEELGEQLYNLKKSDPKMYESCIAMLDNQVNMIEKSGLFTEIGKSASGTTGGGAKAKAEARAKEIMKSDNCDYTTAIAKAWEDPDLMAEADAEYFGK